MVLKSKVYIYSKVREVVESKNVFRIFKEYRYVKGFKEFVWRSLMVNMGVIKEIK